MKFFTAKLKIITIVMCLLNAYYCKSCGNDIFSKEKIQFLKPFGETYNRILKKDQKFENLRIHLDYSSIDSDKQFTTDYNFLKDKVMPEVEKVYENILKVKRLTNMLKFDSNHCAGVDIPDKFYKDGAGINADLIIFVKIDSSGFFEANGIEAAATHCIIHKDHYRPLAGTIIFKPNLIEKKGNISQSDVDYITWLAVHEVSHILAFNSRLYEFFIDETGKRLGYSNVVGKFKFNGINVSYIKTPILLEKARKHFNCEDLLGVPLEYHGGEGTAGAHWSKRFMNTDYMIGDSYGENHISEITLAIFEDSGWYKVDYSKGNLFTWGKNKGCKFFDESFPCIENITDQKKSLKKERKNEKVSKTELFSTYLNKLHERYDDLKKNKKGFVEIKDFKEFNVKYKSNFENEFCEGFNMPTCSINHHFKATCKAFLSKKDLPKHERYFKNPRLGSVDGLTDRCPIPIESKLMQRYNGGSCKLGKINNPKDFADHSSWRTEEISKYPIEKICPECVCIMSSLRISNENFDKIEKKNEKVIKSNDKVKRKNSKQNETTDSDSSDANSEDDNNSSSDKDNIDIDKPQETKKEESSSGTLSYEEPESKNSSVISSQTNDVVEISDIELYEVTTLYDTLELGNDIILANCFETSCEGSKKEDLFILFEIKGKRKKIQCKEPGFYSVQNFKGIIQCPDPKLICSVKYKCKYGCL